MTERSTPAKNSSLPLIKHNDQGKTKISNSVLFSTLSQHGETSLGGHIGSSDQTSQGLDKKVLVADTAAIHSYQPDDLEGLHESHLSPIKFNFPLRQMSPVWENTTSEAANSMSVELVSDPITTVFKVMVMFLIIASAVVGNTLVIVSVLKYQRLRIIANSFIVSMAMADLLVASVVMTFSASQEVLGYWKFGELICDLFNANDVLFSTASLQHLCCISVDRYIAVTDPFHYESRMTRRRVGVMLSCVWASSALISHAPIHAGWYRTHTSNSSVRIANDLPECHFTVNQYYSIISSTISFWLPVVVMVVMYVKIFREARRQERMIIELSRQFIAPEYNSVTAHLSPVPHRKASRLSKINGGSNMAPNYKDQVSGTSDETMKLVDIALDSRVTGGTPCSGHIATSYRDTLGTTFRDNNGAFNITSSGTTYSNNLASPLKNNIATSYRKSSTYSSNTGSPCRDGIAAPCRDSIAALYRDSITTPCRDSIAPLYSRNIGTPSRASCVSRTDIDSSTPTKVDHLASSQKRLAHHRKKIQRENKAARTLGIIMGGFLCCWLPFFTWYLTSSFCPQTCHTPPALISVLFWIGYLNSALNPLIYAFFNRDFREAFRRILRLRQLRTMLGMDDSVVIYGLDESGGKRCCRGLAGWMGSSEERSPPSGSRRGTCQSRGSGSQSPVDIYTQVLPVKPLAGARGCSTCCCARWVRRARPATSSIRRDTVELNDLQYMPMVAL